jgi:hypothetical protein
MGRRPWVSATPRVRASRSRPVWRSRATWSRPSPRGRTRPLKGWRRPSRPCRRRSPSDRPPSTKTARRQASPASTSPCSTSIRRPMSPAPSAKSGGLRTRTRLSPTASVSACSPGRASASSSRRSSTPPSPGSCSPSTRSPEPMSAWSKRVGASVKPWLPASSSRTTSASTAPAKCWSARSGASASRSARSRTGAPSSSKCHPRR